jgi:DNA polymerase II small subunit/DNA polymerase delta subunit B
LKIKAKNTLTLTYIEIVIMGRPATKPTELRDGFYIEIRNRGSKAGVKIRRDTEAQMHLAIKEYEPSKDVVVIGEVSKGKILSGKK